MWKKKCAENARSGSATRVMAVAEPDCCHEIIAFRQRRQQNDNWVRQPGRLLVAEPNLIYIFQISTKLRKNPWFQHKMGSATWPTIGC